VHAEESESDKQQAEAAELKRAAEAEQRQLEEEAGTYPVYTLSFAPDGSDVFYLTLGGKAAGKVRG
jgi:hypothetical protein